MKLWLMPKNKEIKQVGIKLEKFNLERIQNNKIIVMVGSRGRGKSTILLDYLYHNQDIPFATCIAPTDSYNMTFSPHIPSRFIFSEYTPELVAGFLKRQMQLKNKQQEARLGMGDPAYKDVDCRGILIMDDCLAANKNWTSDAGLRWIFFNGRHVNITFILTMQYQLGIKPAYRANIDWVFLCKENKRIERKKLWEYYAGIFPTFQMFEQIFLKCTTDKKCMVINALSEDERLENQVFWFKASLRGDFRICYDEFWENNEYYFKRRLAVQDPTQNMNSVMPGQKQASLQQRGPPPAEQDDIYRYIGHGKIRYNLDMSEPDDEDGW